MFVNHGGQLEELSEQYRIAPENIIDFSVNVNPLGPSESIIEILRKNIFQIYRYPDTESRHFRRKLADKLNLSYENIIVGNGSNELIFLLLRAYPESKVLIINPTYSEYERGARVSGANIEYLLLRWQDSFYLDKELLIQKARNCDFVFLCNPNNPTGHLTESSLIVEILRSLPSTTFVVDEAFMDFVDECSKYQLVSEVRNFPNLIVLRSMTKIFAIPGLRLGYLTANTETIKRMNQVREPWSVNILAQIVGEHLLEQKEYVENTIKFINKERLFLINELSQLGWLRVFPSSANFILSRINAENLDSKDLCFMLMNSGFAIRNCSNFMGLDNKFFRIAIREHFQNERLIEKFHDLEIEYEEK